MPIKTKQKKKKNKKTNEKYEQEKSKTRIYENMNDLPPHPPSPITLITTSHPQPISHPVFR